MSVAAPHPLSRYDNGAEWLRSIGGVPLERVVFNPPPGTATEADLLIVSARRNRACELIDHTLVEKPVGLIESAIAAVVVRLLGNWAEDTKLGIVFGPDSTLRMVSGRVRLSDAAYIAFTSLPSGQLPNEPIPSLAPDLAVEVLSDSNTSAEMAQKLKDYFQSGARLAWIIDPRTKTVAVYEAADVSPRILGEADSLDGGTVLPRFTTPVAALFKNIPPHA